ncbi:nucleotide-binding protein [Bacillus thuringiensis]|nr:nucleotide-binding protein [Bacillus thuringiensis]
MDKIKLLTELKEKTNELRFNDSPGLKNLKLEAKLLFKKILEDSEVEEYINAIEGARFYLMAYSNYTPETAERKQWEEGKNSIIGTVDVIIKMLSLESSLPKKSELDLSASPQNNKVFIVHGHDEAMKLHVKDTLTRLNLEPIILHEQLDQGDTVIEKFEREAKNVSFAIILLSPDDRGKAVNDDIYRPRARQNVILELGYFTGKLGRNRTFNLVKNPSPQERIEQPNDISGVIYHEFDSAGGWKLKLSQSLKGAGYNIDLSNLI